MILFTLMILVAIYHEDGILKAHEFDAELTRIKETNEELRYENASLRKEIHALKSDAFAIEKIAREKLHLTKPGETVYQVVRQPK